MENFIYSIPTEIYFGKGQIVNIGRIVSGYGRKALLVYGGGSIKRNGIYDDVVKSSKRTASHGASCPAWSRIRELQRCARV